MEWVLRVEARCDLDVCDILEPHLTALNGAFVEHLWRNRPRRQVDAFLLRLVQDRRKEAHLKLKRQHIHASRPAFSAFGDDLLDKQTSNGKIDRADNNEASAGFSVKEPRLRKRLGAIGLQDEITKLLLLPRKRLLPLLTGESARHVQINLTLVAAQIEHLEGTERLVGGLSLALDIDQTLSGRVDRELSKIRN